MTQQETRPKPLWLPYGDPLRVTAAVAVVLIHVTSQAVAEFGRLRARDWWLYLAVQAATRWAVPAFVMLSGALLLDPAREEPLGRFLARRFTRIGVPTVCWSVFYLGWRWGYKHEHLTAWLAARDLAFGTPFAHLYFLYLLSGLYLATPLLRPFVATASGRRLAFAAGGLMLVGAGDKLIRTVWGGAGSGLLLFVPYLGYYLTGYLLRDVRLDPRGRRWAAAVAVAAWLAMVGATRGLYGVAHGPAWRSYAIEFLSPLTIVCSLAVWLWLTSRLSAITPSPLWTRLGAATLGIYLVHPAVLAVLRDHGLSPAAGPAVVVMPLAAGAALLISGAITVALLQVPLVRRVVGG